jgi:hypothetical protein
MSIGSPESAAPRARVSGIVLLVGGGGHPLRATVTREFVTKNWYLAVGRGMTNTTGTVTVVPGADGKPKVSLDYQVNVWDRSTGTPASRRRSDRRM